MFGTNTPRKQDLSQGSHLDVQEIFYTIQGEGPYAGMPAVFIRLWGCNLRCYFCDTDFESHLQHLMVDRILLEVMRVASRKPGLVVITGGEPFRQNLVPLIRLLLEQDILVQIETAGTLWVEGLEIFRYAWYQDLLTLVCSPKTGSVNRKIQEYCRDWKFLIQEGAISEVDGLPIMSTQDSDSKRGRIGLFRPHCSPEHIWLQPCEAYKVEYKKPISLPESGSVSESDLLRDQVITSALRDFVQTQRNIRLCGALAMKYGYRVSLQLHKILELP